MDKVKFRGLMFTVQHEYKKVCPICGQPAYRLNRHGMTNPDDFEEGQPRGLWSKIWVKFFDYSCDQDHAYTVLTTIDEDQSMVLWQ